MTHSIRPNLHLIYVSDIARSTNFYRELFQMDPVFSSPHYVAFAADEQGNTLFALWSRGEAPTQSSPHFGEIGVMVATNAEVDSLFEKWRATDGVIVLKPPHNEVFGRTFLLKDPDGHVIRVSPRD